MPRFRVLEGGKKPRPAPPSSAITDTTYAEAITRLAKLDRELRGGVDDLRADAAHTAVRDLAASRGIKATIVWLRQQQQFLEELRDTVRP